MERELPGVRNSGILDRSLFRDNVHPTLRGFYYMRLAGADLGREQRAVEAEFGPPAEVTPLGGRRNRAEEGTESLNEAGRHTDRK